MAISKASFIRETSSTGGTGTYNLGGATGRFQSFVDGVGDAATVYYAAFDDQDFEVGIGTVTDASPDTLSRDTIIESSNADAAVDWPSSGQRTIICTALPSKTLEEDENGDVGVTRDVAVGRNLTAEGTLHTNGAYNYDATDTGAADAYAIQLASTLAAYSDGMLVSFRAANANTGASTLNINAIGAKNLKRVNGDALESGDIAEDDIVIAYFDETADEFRAINIAGDVIRNGGTTLPDILSDTLANRPAAGKAGRWFYATDESRWYRDTGAAWEVKGGHLERADIERSATLAIGNAGFSPIEFDTENHDPDGMWDAGSPTVVTMPRDGVIQVTVRVTWEANATGYRAIQLATSLATVGTVNNLPIGGTTDDLNAFTSNDIEISSGETIGVNVFQNSGGNLDLKSANITVRYVE